MHNSAATDIVSQVEQNWVRCFGKRDIEGLSQLYSREACLFGGKPELFRTRDGVRSYFSALPTAPLRAEFGERTVLQLSPTVISSAGFMKFCILDAEPSQATHPYRITLILVEEDGDWKIAGHHASPVP